MLNPSRAKLISTIMLSVLLVASGSVGQAGRAIRSVAVEPPYVSGQFLVKFKPGTTAEQKGQIQQSTGTAVKGSFLIDSQLKVMRILDGSSLTAKIDAYRQSPAVLYAERDYLYRAATIPNDPRFDEQWGLENTAQPGTDMICLGGSNSGQTCSTDTDCGGTCSDDTSPCSFNSDCDGFCSQDTSPCVFDWECQSHCAADTAPCTSDLNCQSHCSNDFSPCISDIECGSGQCSNSGASCTLDFQCGGRVCEGGVTPGATCISDFDCDDRVCTGGPDNGQPCTFDGQCDATCQNGTNPGSSCTNSSQCGATCQNGTNPGSSCTNNSQCGATCQGGPSAGQSCNPPFGCGTTCVGGSNNGRICSFDAQCPSGTCVSWTCVPGECISGMCIGGQCSDPGSCGAAPTCNAAPTCLPDVCNQATCTAATCIGGACGASTGLPDFDVDATDAWNIVSSSPNVIIAIIDSGVDFSHEDMPDAWINAGEIPGNGIDDDGNGYVDDVGGWDFVNGDNDPNDDFWHGTFATGVAAARGNNGLGITGVTWNAQIMALKGLDQEGLGSASQLITAIEYATNEGAHVINASWGGLGFNQSLTDAIEQANLAGILFVAAAGNSSVDTDAAPDYPSSHGNGNIISVASVDRFGELSSFSNWGATTVDLAAPGSAILSTSPITQYGVEDGTSFAAPFVTGAIALLYAFNPQLDHLQARQNILNSVMPDDDLQLKTVTGGVLNVADALAITSPCGASTCSSVGASCGTIDDGCGNQLNCGFCSGNDQCVDNVCVCTPATCSSLGASCGTIDDGCGTPLSCGSCSGNDQCVANACVCIPTTCAAAGAQCGTIDDGCGVQLSCGACSGSDQCIANACVCVPATCEELNLTCGVTGDGCGGSLDCGLCGGGGPGDDPCSNDDCPPRPRPKKKE